MTEPTSPTHISVAGLSVPVQLVPRIVAAMRGTYPDITEGLNNDAAVRAVLRWWVKATLIDWESKKAEAPVDEAVEATRRAYREAAELARQAAQAAADLIEEPTAEPDLVLSDFSGATEKLNP